MCQYATARKFFHKFNGEDPPWKCWVCGLPIVVRGGWSSEALTVHHENGNIGDNARSNLKATHKGCHQSYHQTGKKPSELNRRVNGLAVAESNRRRSGKNWRGNQYTRGLTPPACAG
jgi:hypothetical protein